MFEMKTLPYNYSGLEPIISTTTVNIHYNKHYLGGNIYLPDDIENYVVQNLRKNVEWLY